MTAQLATSPVDALNSLLRSSIAARESYLAAIKKVERDAYHHAIALRVIKRNHLDHAKRLRREIVGLKGSPDDESPDSWGFLMRRNEECDTAFTAVKALKEGERRVIDTALTVLTELEGSTAAYVRNTLLPDLVQHVELLDAIEKPV